MGPCHETLVLHHVRMARQVAWQECLPALLALGHAGAHQVSLPKWPIPPDPTTLTYYMASLDAMAHDQRLRSGILTLIALIALLWLTGR